MAYPGAVVGALTDIHDSALNPVGTRRVEPDGNEYIYLLGVASTVATDWVTFDEVYATTRAVAGAVGSVAVAMAAVVANKYGWYQIYGLASAKGAANFADNKAAFLTATDGVADDAVVAGDLIVGAISREVITTAAAMKFQLSYPTVSDASA